jgi:microcystin-dependent protein
VQAIGTAYTITGAIATSVYTTVTTVTVAWDSGSLDNTVSALAVGILQNQLWALSALMPPGIVVDFGGSAAPSGFLVCDGSAKSRTTYANLFAAIGTTWGAGDGSTTFNVPNMARRVRVGSGGTGTGTLANTVGATGGEETHTLTATEMPSHNHPVNISDPTHSHLWGVNNQNSGGAGAGSLGGSGTGSASSTSSASTGISATTSNVGSGAAHNNMQPSAVVLTCIKY